MSQRTERVDELLRQEISAVLAREVSDPRIGFATITDVETTPDLAHARIWVSIIGSPEERATTLRALAGAMPFVRRQLGGRLHLRRIPELHVRLDETAERGTRILRLISDLEGGRDAESEPGIEPLPTPGPRPDVTPEPAPSRRPARRPRPGARTRPPAGDRRREHR